MVKRYYSFGEIFAAIVIIIVLLITSYRLAVIFDWLPEDFKPSEIALHRYQDLKALLLREGMQPGAVGSVSRSTLDTFNSVEKYIKKKQDEQKRQEQLPEECRNDSVFRWFMYMSGAPDNSGCNRENLRMQKAMEDINGTKKVKKPNVQQPEQTQVPAVQPDSQQQLQQLQQEIKQYQPQDQSAPVAAPVTQ